MNHSNAITRKASAALLLIIILGAACNRPIPVTATPTPTFAGPAVAIDPSLIDPGLLGPLVPLPYPLLPGPYPYPYGTGPGTYPGPYLLPYLSPYLVAPVITLPFPSYYLNLTLLRNANCRHGPGQVYPVLTSVLAGQTVQLDGRNVANTWWHGIIPGNFKCWISSVAGTPDGDSNNLPVLEAPPTPTPTVTPRPNNGGGNGDGDFDKDGYAASRDCNDRNAKIHPGAPETPDDKVDSNCNGNDDQ